MSLILSSPQNLETKLKKLEDELVLLFVFWEYYEDLEYMTPGSPRERELLKIELLNAPNEEREIPELKLTNLKDDIHRLITPFQKANTPVELLVKNV